MQGENEELLALLILHFGHLSPNCKKNAATVPTGNRHSSRSAIATLAMLQDSRLSIPTLYKPDYSSNVQNYLAGEITPDKGKAILATAAIFKGRKNYRP